MANTKVQWSGKINIEKKKLVERKRKLISASTGCNRAYPYMDVLRSIFDELRGVSLVGETLCQMLDITSQTKWS